MEMQKTNNKQIRRTDESIQDEIRRSLWNEETIRTIDILDISVKVDQGQVCLFGHVSKGDNYQIIEEFIRSIPGVVAVHNHLVSDHDLTIQVTNALANYETTLLFSIHINSNNGWIELRGSVPNREIQGAAEAIAASVSAVRGVILVPEIPGEPIPTVRNAVQPRIGVSVFGMAETQGIVYQVVITPKNRLVTHAIVRVNRWSNGWKEWCDYLIPVETMDMVDIGGIFLNSSTPAIHLFPGFTPSDYPFAPLTWQPPYPYTVGNVRWPQLEKVKAEQLRPKYNIRTNGVERNQ